MKALLAAAGCTLAAAAFSGCSGGDFAVIVCLLNGGVPTNAYGGVSCPRQNEAGQRADAAQSRRGRPFSARMRARLVHRAVKRRRHANGTIHKGMLTLSARGGAAKALRGFTRGRFRSRMNVRVGGDAGLGLVDGYMAIRYRHGGAACLRVATYVTEIEDSTSAQTYFRSAGGIGRAAHLRISGQAPYDPLSKRVRGTLTATRGPARPPSRACRRLLARIPERA